MNVVSLPMIESRRPAIKPLAGLTQYSELATVCDAPVKQLSSLSLLTWGDLDHKPRIRSAPTEVGKSLLHNHPSLYVQFYILQSVGAKYAFILLITFVLFADL